MKLHPVLQNKNKNELVPRAAHVGHDAHRALPDVPHRNLAQDTHTQKPILWKAGRPHPWEPVMAHSLQPFTTLL